MPVTVRLLSHFHSPIHRLLRQRQHKNHTKSIVEKRTRKTNEHISLYKCYCYTKILINIRDQNTDDAKESQIFDLVRFDGILSLKLIHKL